MYAFSLCMPAVPASHGLTVSVSALICFFFLDIAFGKTRARNMICLRCTTTCIFRCTSARTIFFLAPYPHAPYPSSPPPLSHDQVIYHGKGLADSNIFTPVQTCSRLFL
jgi:hypothetical protein